eukprot:188834-Hanusia_phi.AAC.2
MNGQTCTVWAEAVPLKTFQCADSRRVPAAASPIRVAGVRECLSTGGVLSLVSEARNFESLDPQRMQLRRSLGTIA